MRFVNSMLDIINKCPEYIGKGILHLLILTVGGVFVAWITTFVFGRKSEINAVEGVLLKRKIDIYEELSGKLEALKEVVIIPPEIHAVVLRMLEEEEIPFNTINSDQLLKIFDSPMQLTDAYLELDKYITSKRLYFDNEVMIQTIRFQNYFAILRRLLVMYEEQFEFEGISLVKKEVAVSERILTAVLGILLQDEFINQIDKVISTMGQSIVNLNFNHRGQIKYSHEFFNSLDGPIMSELRKTKALSQSEIIRELVTKVVALGMAGSVILEDDSSFEKK